jgi:hypothetical protein
MGDEPFEIKFNGTDWASYGFKLVKDGVQGIDEMRQVRQDIVWVPGRDEPYYFGAFLGEKHITVTGLVKATSRANLVSYLGSIKTNLQTSLTAARHLVFGDSADYYQAIYDGTFSVQFIGSGLTSTAAIISVGFLITADRWVTS